MSAEGERQLQRRDGSSPHSPQHHNVELKRQQDATDAAAAAAALAAGAAGVNHLRTTEPDADPQLERDPSYVRFREGSGHYDLRRGGSRLASPDYGMSRRGTGNNNTFASSINNNNNNNNVINSSGNNNSTNEGDADNGGGNPYNSNNNNNNNESPTGADGDDRYDHSLEGSPAARDNDDLVLMPTALLEFEGEREFEPHELVISGDGGVAVDGEAIDKALSKLLRQANEDDDEEQHMRHRLRVGQESPANFDESGAIIDSHNGSSSFNKRSDAAASTGLSVLGAGSAASSAEGTSRHQHLHRHHHHHQHHLRADGQPHPDEDDAASLATAAAARRKHKRATRQQRLGQFIDRAAQNPTPHFWVTQQSRGQPVMMRMFPRVQDLRAYVTETKERIKRRSIESVKEKLAAKRKAKEARRLRHEARRDARDQMTAKSQNDFGEVNAANNNGPSTATYLRANSANFASATGATTLFGEAQRTITSDTFGGGGGGENGGDETAKAADVFGRVAAAEGPQSNRIKDLYKRRNSQQQQQQQSRSRKKHRKSRRRRSGSTDSDDEDANSVAGTVTTRSTSTIRRRKPTRGTPVHDSGSDSSKTNSSDDDSDTDSDTSDSSSSSSSSDEEETIWIDVQSQDPTVIRVILSLFPNIRRGTIESIIDKEEDDVQNVHHFDYVSMQITVPVERSNRRAAATAPSPSSTRTVASPGKSVHPGFNNHYQQHYFYQHHVKVVPGSAQWAAEHSAPRLTTISLVAMKRWCITVHDEPFVGLGATVNRVHSHFCAAVRKSAAVLAAKTAAAAAQHHNHQLPHPHQQPHHPAAQPVPRGLLTGVPLKSPQDRAVKPDAATNNATAFSLPAPLTGGAGGAGAGVGEAAATAAASTSRTATPSQLHPSALRRTHNEKSPTTPHIATITSTSRAGGGALTSSATAADARGARGSSPTLAAAAPGGGAAVVAPAAPGARPRGPLLTVAWLVAAFVELVIDATLPDPLPLLTAVDAIDELVLRSQQLSATQRAAESRNNNQLPMLGPGDRQSQHNELIGLIARIRRVLFTHRGVMNRKEHLLVQMLSSSMKTSRLMAYEGAHEHYKIVLASLGRISRRLEDAREALSQSNSNLVSLISTQQAKSANEMSAQMKILSLVTLASLPLSLMTGLFGTNVRVPANQSPDTNDLTPFIIMGTMMLTWLLISIPWLFWYFDPEAKGFWETCWGVCIRWCCCLSGPSAHDHHDHHDDMVQEMKPVTVAGASRKVLVTSPGSSARSPDSSPALVIVPQDEPEASPFETEKSILV